VHCSSNYLPLSAATGSSPAASPSRVSRILLQKLKLIWAHTGFKFIFKYQSSGHTRDRYKQLPRLYVMYYHSCRVCPEKYNAARTQINAHGIVEVYLYIHRLLIPRPLCLGERASGGRLGRRAGLDAPLPAIEPRLLGCASLLQKWSATEEVAYRPAVLRLNWLYRRGHTQLQQHQQQRPVGGRQKQR
jgi:hypothetical protein